MDIYASRLSHYTTFGIDELPELKNAASLSKTQIMQKEGEMILKALKAKDFVILLDEKAKEFGSVGFAKELSVRRQAGRDLAFVIGGAYGFSPDVYARADSKMSLSKMTFSHQMVRTIFAEQLYRAFTILRGEPYHHE